MAQEFHEDRVSTGRQAARVEPGEWVPLLLDAYEILSTITKHFGVGVVVAGASAYAVQVEADPTKDVDFVLTKPLPVEKLSTMVYE